MTRLPFVESEGARAEAGADLAQVIERLKGD
jgi:hypothetical protein